MEGEQNFADAIRKTGEAYAEALAAVTKALESLPRGGEEHRRQAEQWLRLARMSKDSVVTAIEQGFELWERQCRRVMGAPHPGPGAAAGPEAWAEGWRKTLDAFSAPGAVGEAWSEAARKQADLAQKAWSDGLRAWQRLWQPPGR